MSVNFVLVGGPHAPSTGLSVIKKAASGAGKATASGASQIAKPVLMLTGDVAAPVAKGFFKTMPGKITAAALALLATTGVGKAIYDKVQEKKEQDATPTAPETGSEFYSFA